MKSAPHYDGPERRSEERPGKFDKFVLNVVALFDQSAWLLLIPVFIMGWFVEPSKVKTIAQWSVLATGLCGLALVLSRIMMPRIKVDGLIGLARTGNNAAGMMILGYQVMLGLIILALCIWAKP